VLQPDDPSQVRSPRGGCVRSDGEARWVQQLGTDPRKSEVVRTSRSNADDAEFEREDPED